MKYNGFYYHLFKGSMKRTLLKYFDHKYVNNLMKKSFKTYKKIVAAAPDIGDDNPMALNLYFALSFLSPYIASKKEVTPVIVQEMMKNGLYHVRWFFSMVNVNTKKGKIENQKSITKYIKWYTKEKEEKYPDSFKVDYVDKPYPEACYYRITRCPIFKYAKVLNVEEVMPLLCDLDKVMIHLEHGKLNRKCTIANGDPYCDYWIVGDKTNR